MSILKKPYELSVWDDVWNPTLLKFEEKRLGIIGSNDMSYQGRAIEPNLVRNVNGTKKFSFKMYRYFVDNETGEKVENPFINWLVSERKVKLHYKGKWYDFIVKNIVENSSNYLYTYQLEDALVLELSKNGFGVTLDTKLMNNMGTAEELAEYVLAETDWNVKTEAFVEQVEDNLVYVKMPTDLSALNIYRIRDQVIVSGADNKDGTEEILLTETTDIKKSDLSGKEILAFYTSCTNKPNRFQFIYISEGYYKENDKGKRIPSVPVDKNQIINVKDCQYYCEIDKPELDGEYVKSESFPQFYLPKNFTVFNKGQSGISNSNDTTISVWYRGKRYGFAQSAKYIPLLDRYCNEYTKGTIKYYGFVDNDYASPALLQNIITNTEFKGTTGWVGTYSGSTPNAKVNFGTEVEAVYGRFNSGNFSSVVDELSNGTYKSDNKYEAYLKVTFPTNGSADKAILLNTGFYNNRTLIKQVDYDEEWYFNTDIVDDSGAAVDAFAKFDFILREVSFNPLSGSYVLGDIWAEYTSKTIDEETVHLLKFNSDKKKSNGYADVKISEKDFKKKEVKLVITPKSNNAKTTYYIKDMQLFKLILNDESKIIKPGAIDTEGVVKTTYRFFPAAYVQEIEGSSIDVVTDAENISYENFDKIEIDYSVYKPKYNAGAQKVRSVDAKESNYFNILQKIAETFEIWLELEIERDALGGIISKTAKFKNYVGKDNHAAFRYGVNLKDIQRTYESKNIVTKLIVKQNSNEQAQNGFCTIARAGSNQTGENYIYDFRYFHDRDMLDTTDYVSSLYYNQNPYHKEIIACGLDIDDNENAEATSSQDEYTTTKDQYNVYVGKTYTFTETITNNASADKLYILGGILEWEIPNTSKMSAINQDGNSQIGLEFQFTGESGKWPDQLNTPNIYLSQNSGKEFVIVAIPGNFLTNNEKPATGIRFQEIRKINKSWTTGYSANATTEYDEYFYGTETSGMNITLKQLRLMSTVDSEFSSSWTIFGTNLQNYFNRIKSLNTKIENINETIIPLTTELTKYKAELEVQSGLREAASEGNDQVREDFAVLTGLTPETCSQQDIKYITCIIPDKNATGKDTNGNQISGAGVNVLNSQDWAKDATVQATNMQTGVNNSTKWKFGITLANTWTECSDVKLKPYSATITNDDGTYTSHGYNGLKVTFSYKQNKQYELSYKIAEQNNDLTVISNLTRIGGHNLPFSNNRLEIKVGENGEWKEYTSDSYGGVVATPGTTIYVKQSGTYNKPDVTDVEAIGTDCFFIQPNRGDLEKEKEKIPPVTFLVSDVVLKECNLNTSSRERTIYIQPTFTLTPNSGPNATRIPKIPCTIPAYSNTGTKEYSLAIVDTTASNISSLLTEYATYLSQYNESVAEEASLQAAVAEKESEIESKQQEIETLLKYKKALNQLFYSRYSRFIQEGTWMDEKYIDDDKYYADAQSVMYNSCYPQVAYNINVIALDALPEYEGFDFELGDKTYAVDPEFFGEDYQEEVIINEMSTNLDDPTKDQIKVQNFKNQFQDLFQKITATVQQAQYSTGSYEKAVALAEANAAVKSEFLQDALNDASSKLITAGQTTVKQGADGITLTDKATKNQMRLIGGAILMSVEDENGQRKWKTGLTPDGISASLVTAGTINTGNISIMNGKDATFMWNAYGLSAFDVDWTNGEITGTPKKNKFVRFDKYGIYGINDNGADSIDGTAWKPTSNDEIDDKATFALTWEGLKVTGNKGVTAKIGKQDEYIMRVDKAGESEPNFSITNNGDVSIKGKITAIDGKIGGVDFVSRDNLDYKNLVYNSNFTNGLDGWTIFYNANSHIGVEYIGKPTGANNEYAVEIQNFGIGGYPGIATPFLPKEDTRFKVGDVLTLSCKYMIPKIYSWDASDQTHVLAGVEIKREGRDGGLAYCFADPSKTDCWNLISCTYTITEEDADIPCHIRLWLNDGSEDANGSRSVPYVVYFTDIQLELNGQATSWTPNIEDPIIKPNLLTGTQDLSVMARYAGVLNAQAGTQFYELNATVSEINSQIGYQNLMSFDYTVESGEVYTLSFWARGDINDSKKSTILLYSYSYNSDGSPTEPTPSSIHSSWGDPSSLSHDGCTSQLSLESYYKRYWVTWSFQDTRDSEGSRKNTPKQFLWRAMTTGNFSIYGVKLEKGHTMTDWCEDSIPASSSGDYSWEFSNKTGITMWNGTKGNGVPGSGESCDNNVVFKIFKDSTSNQNVLYLKGTGIFEGGTSGITADLIDEKGKPYSVSDLVFKAGDGFGVTTDGTIYANKGKIGSLEIGDIASTDNIAEAVNNIEIGGKNLVLKSDQFKESSEYLVATYDLSEDWSLNTEYCITIKGEVNKGQAFGIWANGPSTDLASLTLDTTTGLHKAVFTTPSSITVSGRIKTLWVYNCAGSSASYAKIDWIKLEKGNKATDWTPAPEDVEADAQEKADKAAQDAINDAKIKYAPLISDDEAFSWKFSKNSGFYMYNGKASADKPDEVFKIYKNEDPNKNRYEAWMKGHVIATSGEIGSWTLDSTKMYSTGTGMAVNTGYPNDPAFWAGYNGAGNTPWEESNGWQDKTRLYITNSGDLVMTDSLAAATLSPHSLFTRYGAKTTFTLDSLEPQNSYKGVSTYLKINATSYEPDLTIPGYENVKYTYKDFGNHEMKIGLEVTESYTYGTGINPGSITKVKLVPHTFFETSTALTITAVNDIKLQFQRGTFAGSPVVYTVKVSDLYKLLYPDKTLPGEDNIGSN